jgi:hypothetical protein
MTAIIRPFLVSLVGLAGLAPPEPINIRDAADSLDFARTDHSRRFYLRQILGDELAAKIDAGNWRELLGRLSLRELVSLDRAAFKREFGMMEGAINAGSAYDACNTGPDGKVHQYDPNNPNCNPNACGEDFFGIKTQGQSGFPLAGGVTAVLTKQTPKQRTFKPTSWWACFFDAAIASQPTVNVEVVNVKVRSTDQFIGGPTYTKLFADLKERTPCNWDIIDSSVGAEVTVTNILAPAVTVQGYIHIWGIANVPIEFARNPN